MLLLNLPIYSTNYSSQKSSILMAVKIVLEYWYLKKVTIWTTLAQCSSILSKTCFTEKKNYHNMLSLCHFASFFFLFFILLSAPSWFPHTKCLSIKYLKWRTCCTLNKVQKMKRARLFSTGAEQAVTPYHFYLHAQYFRLWALRFPMIC